MGVTREMFYDPKQNAILPMGFCFPGTGKSGDLPPRPECAPAWRAQLLGRLRNLQLTLLVGQYAQAHHLVEKPATLTDTVKAWRDYWQEVMPLPHPSPRKNIWMSRNRWLEADLLPSLLARVSEVLLR